MAPPLRTTTRRRVLAVLAAGATAASSAALLAPGTSTASSHREAPYTLSDPQADNTDVYAFVSPDAPDTVTLAANFQGFQEPAQGPNYYPWDDKARYEIHIDNNGDAKPDLTYRWSFKDIDNRGTAERGAVDGTFLLNDGPVNSFDDATLKFKQTYTLQAIRYAANGGEQPTTLVTDGRAAPPNVGRASTPNYAKLRAEAVTATSVAGGKAFAGPSDDPFFLDLRIFDLLYGGDLSETGYDGLSGYNVNTLALQLPKAQLVAGGDASKNPVIGVWSTTSRQQNRVLLGNNAAPQTGVNQDSDTIQPSGDFVQVSRLGNPLVNEAVVPANLKDFFNRSTPDTDAKFLPKVQNPEVPVLIEQIYKIPNPKALGGPAANRNDLSAAFLTGFSKDVFAGKTFKVGEQGIGAGVLDADLNSLDLNEVSPNPAPAEYLRLNVNVAPKSPGQRGFSRLGAVGGDLAGFPNGRRLQDDVVDIALQVLEGVLVRPAGATKNAVAGLGDGVNSSDKRLSATFPYVALPHSGSELRKGTSPLQFRQQFTSHHGKVQARAYGISPGAKGGTAQLVGVMGNGSLKHLGFAKLNASGTATSTIEVAQRPGRQLTLLWRITPARGAGAEAVSGPPTTVTVR